MKDLSMLIYFVLLFSFSIGAQAPPAPLIYSAPKKNEINKYLDKENNFAIDFAGKVNTSTIQISVGVQNTYSSKVIGSLTQVKVTTRNNRLKENEFKPHLEKLKQEHLKASENALTYEKVINGDEYDGIEFAYKKGYEYAKVRLFVVGRKTFELYIDVTNWHILTDNRKDKVKEFEDEANRFFSSFKYLPTRIKGTGDSTALKIAQKKAPKPKSVISSKSKDIKNDVFIRKTRTFNSPRGAFSVYFPFRPNRRIFKVQSTEGNADFVIHQAATKYYSYSVAYIDSPTVVDLEEEKLLNYDAQIKEIETKIKGKVLRQSEITKYGFKGRDYIIITKSLTVSVRMFIANQRLFRLAVFTRGRPIRRTGKLTRSNQRIVDRFFDSFKVTKLPNPKFSAVELPNDFGSDFLDDKYKSSYFGFSSTVPTAWTILDELEAELIFKYGTVISLEETQKYRELTKRSAENTKVLFLAMKQESEEDEPILIAVAAESLSTPVFVPKSVIESNIITKEDYEEISIGVSSRIIDGVNFAWYETRDTNDQTFNRFFVANLNNLAFEIVFVYKIKDDLKDLEMFLNSIKFEKNNE